MTSSFFIMKKFLINFLVLFLALNTWGQYQKQEYTIENALLWEISGNGLKQPSYLYGTIHMIGKNDFFLSEATKNALKACNKVTFEINMEEMTDFSKIMPLMMRAFMNNDTTLKDLLMPEDYKIVEQHFQKIGLPIIFLEKIKPMFLSAFASEDMASMQSNPEAIVSYEFELMKMAQEDNKTIGGLETAEYQMSMFDSIPYKVQAQMLLESIKIGNTENSEFEKMIQLYKDQDIEGMQQMMKDDENGIGKYEELLLVNRNRNWIPVMKSMMVEQPTFFAVGAGHLGGSRGVVQLLIQEGYHLKPIP